MLPYNSIPVYVSEESNKVTMLYKNIKIILLLYISIGRLVTMVLLLKDVTFVTLAQILTGIEFQANALRYLLCYFRYQFKSLIK